ncbi:hypothetical protein BDF21DRAFT_393532 [Thamnidium elegans]|uniref:Uncharacterized protein n=1 Tax=Thamnidium elegans TaxID=101142 RepID=A0A8H7SKV8_9FUNG|nr:hypothetical protein INT48_003461 [Thamnidium elegans]KAI8095180.1 hypothetical protein BDF21DRAFT_393532 [Thamnidium elegans]
MKFTLSLFICLIFAVKKLNAYCIYNKLDPGAGTFWVRQQPFNAGLNYLSRFYREALAPGESACCPYDVKSCVKPQTREDIIYLTLRRTTGIVEYPPVVVSVPGGGWVSMRGNEAPYEFNINVYNADGTPFDFEYRVDFQAGYL